MQIYSPLRCEIALCATDGDIVPDLHCASDEMPLTHVL